MERQASMWERTMKKHLSLVRAALKNRSRPLPKRRNRKGTGCRDHLLNVAPGVLSMKPVPQPGGLAYLDTRHLKAPGRTALVGDELDREA